MATAVVLEWNLKEIDSNQLIKLPNICEKIKVLWEEARSIALKQKTGINPNKKQKRGQFQEVPLESRLDNLFDVASCKYVSVNDVRWRLILN